MITLLEPAWLLVLLPAGLLAWALRPAGRTRRALRWMLFALVVLAMAEPAWWWARRAGTVVVVADRSASMPADAANAQLEAVNLLHDALDPTRHRLAVVSFGQRSAVELAPGVEGLAAFTQDVGGGASDLAAALRRVQELLPVDAPGRVLLLSDGRATHDAAGLNAAAATLAARGVAVDARMLSRPRTGDAAVRDLQAPPSVGPGEAFMITAWVSVPDAGPRRYVLTRGNTTVASGTRDFAPGTHRLRFRDRLDPQTSPGSAAYTLRFEAGESVEDAAADRDPVPENNTARFVVGVRGPRPILHVTDTPGGGLATLLRGAGLSVTTVTPDALDGSVDTLANHAAVLLENVAAADLPGGTLDALAGLIEATGTGLWMTGGQRSFGPGGYFKSAIDPLLPVSMELRQEHRKLSLAIVVALDRSGSMSMTVPGGRQKMDLANLGTAQVVDLLSSMDEMGIIAVDSAPHVIAPLTQVSDKAALRARALSVDSMGGGIYVYEALEASARMLQGATAGTRHIILFSDAQDSENPAGYRALLENCRKANITVSVIGLGTPADVDAGLLRDIAARGGGRIFFTQDAAKLPALFAQDTFAVARSAFINEPTPVTTTAGYTALTGGGTGGGDAVAGGYNLTYLRPGASPAAVTVDEYKAPFVATWSAGLGRVAALAGEADGEFTAPLGDWPGYGELLASLARFVTGDSADRSGSDTALPPDLMVRRRVEGGDLVLELLLDPDRGLRGDALDLPSDPVARVVIATPGLPPRRVTLPLRFESPDVLSARLPLTSADTAVAALDLGTLGHAALPPARLLYDPEYLPAGLGSRAGSDAADGGATLDRLADVTGGIRRADLPGIWDALPETDRAVPVAWIAWLLAAALLLLDVLERRTGWVSGVFGRRERSEAGKASTETAPRSKGGGRRGPRRASPRIGRTATPPATGGVPEPPASAEPGADAPTAPDVSGGLGSALDAAARRSRNRHGRS